MHLAKSQLSKFILLLFLLNLSACGFFDNTNKKEEKFYALKEPITRHERDNFFSVEEPIYQPKESYPWDTAFVGSYPRITIDFFRCKGNPLNPLVSIAQEGKESLKLVDCGGRTKHGLSLREGQEFVYPVLLDILNYIQGKTGKRVVITSGHRCPTHNLYADHRIANQSSKHMIGAEVDFYVQGMEEKPQEIVDLIFEYYKETESKSIYVNFKRYQKGETNVSIPPWYNKEVFVKLFQKDEGRDIDNRHSYPYISIQVRYDRAQDKRVAYTWKDAHQGYLKY